MASAAPVPRRRTPGRFRAEWERSPERLLALLLLLIVLLAALVRLHGSSVGMYHRVFMGPDTADPELVLFEPRPIRSDEWLRWTPLVTSQSKLDYPETNTALRDGIDLSLIYDVPHGGWTAWFEPQHWMFHLTGNLDFAFSFKWWGLLALSFFAAFTFAHRVGELSPTVSLLVAAFWCLSPFLHWWYQGPAFLPAAYALLALTLCRPPRRPRSVGTRLATGVGVGLLGGAAFLVQYPPFLIGAALPGAVFLLGLLVEEIRAGRTIDMAKHYGPLFAGALLTAGSIVGTFLLTKGPEIERITSSAHPGKRSYHGGQGDVLLLAHSFSTNLSHFLLDESSAARHFTNQSEAAHFLLLTPFLGVAVVAIQVVRFRRGAGLDWASIGVLVLSLGVLVWILTPLGSAVLSPFLSQVPPNRLAYILGFSQLLLLVRLLGPGGLPLLSAPMRWLVAAVSTTAAGAAMIAANLHVADRAPGFVSSRLSWALTLGWILFGLGAMLAWSRRAGLMALVAISASWVVSVNPVYRSLDPVDDTPIVDRIEEISADEPLGAWAINGGYLFENLAVAAGARSLSGSTPYSQEPFWEEHFAGNVEDEEIYDRSAHVAVDFVEGPAEFTLLQTNVVELRIDPCGSEADELDLRWIVSVHPLDFACLELRDTVRYPRVEFSIYEASHQR